MFSQATCSAVRSGGKKEGDWGESILEAEGDINIKRPFTLSFHPSPFLADHAGSGSFITKGLKIVRLQIKPAAFQGLISSFAVMT